MTAMTPTVPGGCAFHAVTASTRVGTTRPGTGAMSRLTPICQPIDSSVHAGAASCSAVRSDARRS
jgi:hypothetical protein